MDLTNSRKVSIIEARVIQKENPDACVVWRPDSSLPEEEQYALVYHE